MAIYNTDFMNNVTNPIKMITGISASIGSDFLVGNLVLLGFSLVFLALTINKEDIVVLLIIDGFLSIIVAILLYFSGLISAVTIAYPVLIFMLALIFKLVSNN